ncbi:glucosamine inositolphosphorylceramide transferase family protein [Roseateles toxinivorans]|uniref:Glucosamine inositolphosphorylceramide transferase 1 N-terminal domain-containing protein n=1 Tax=Roseateles toxinivorans TaxID=270368 RepID=A0A4V3CT26_9BURK|nr:hypothetical protein [Roseateles toxinivorans]TDP63358.1 hypothetical protein DES47_105363 [Roseateles toxinivorans]
MSNIGAGYNDILLYGLPVEAEWGTGTRVQVRALAHTWPLKLGPQASSAQHAKHQYSGLERLYRYLDLRLFGRSLPVAAAPVQIPCLDSLDDKNKCLHLACCHEVADAAAGCPLLCVEYEGLPMLDLESAVRQRLGHPGATLLAQVWCIEAGRARRLLFEGHLDLDHRSLCQSVAQCAAKLPALLRGALTRYPSAAEGTRGEVQPIPAALPAYRQLHRLAKAIVKRLMWRDQWQIETGQVAHPDRQGPGSQRAQICPPPTAFWADPFLLHLQQRLWLLFEELPFASNKGHICAIELDRDGKPLSPPQIALVEPWHLAYPFVWAEEDRVFMIPDASKNRKLNLYQCRGSPLSWDLRCTLIAGERLADATIAAFEGRLWMFASHGDEQASMNDTLHIYWADRIEGPWHAHALNPVKIDARSVRPAGAMWVADGQLYRVVQDCSSIYGGAIHCMRVLRLDEHEFEEVMEPHWEASNRDQATPWHTFNRHAEVTVVDRLRRQPRWRTQ